MTEEVSFKSIKITLSEEACDILDFLKNRGAFRSYSMTIEESIRALYDIIMNIEATEIRGEGKKPLPINLRLETARDIAVRLSRFTVRKHQSNAASAGT